MAVLVIEQTYTEGSPCGDQVRREREENKKRLFEAERARDGRKRQCFGLKTTRAEQKAIRILGGKRRAKDIGGDDRRYEGSVRIP